MEIDLPEFKTVVARIELTMGTKTHLQGLDCSVPGVNLRTLRSVLIESPYDMCMCVELN